MCAQKVPCASLWRPLPALMAGAAAVLWAGHCAAQDSPAAGPPPVEVQVAAGWLSLFPTMQQPAPLRVLVRKNVPGKASVRCRVTIDSMPGTAGPGYGVTGPMSLELDEEGRWYEAVFALSAIAGAPQMATGKIIVRGTADRSTVRLDVPIRLGWGGLAFLERRSVDGLPDAQSVEFSCLENPLLRAEFAPRYGCLSGLFSHLVGADMMVPGDMPIGLSWSGPGDWYQTVQSAPGPAPLIEMEGRCNGERAKLRAELPEASDTLRLWLDAGDAKVAPGPVVLILTRSRQGQDALTLPWHGGQEELQFGAEVQRQVLRQGDSVRLLYWNADWDETLEVTARGPGLGAVEWGAEAPWYNWVCLQPSAAAWGCLEVELRLRQGRLP